MKGREREREIKHRLNLTGMVLISTMRRVKEINGIEREREREREREQQQIVPYWVVFGVLCFNITRYP